MPTTGAYEFKRAAKADAQGIASEDGDIAPGEWAWRRFELDIEENGVKCKKAYLMLYIKDPDCKELGTLWRRFGSQIHGHTIDAKGNVSPSVLHNFVYNGVEQCGFHTQPTKLLDFVDIR